MGKTSRAAKERTNEALQAFLQGCNMVERHPVFSYMYHRVHVEHREGMPYPRDALAAVSSKGIIYCHPTRRADPEQWARAVAHCLLHLGMGQFCKKEQPILWNTACDLAAEKFLSDLKFGRPWYDTPLPGGISDENRLYEQLTDRGMQPQYRGFGTDGEFPDMICGESDIRFYGSPADWPGLFAAGLADAVRSAVRVASGDQESLLSGRDASSRSRAEQAKQWFISSYPLLGALAANFVLIEDPQVCQRMQISVAAIAPGLSEIYMNPAAGLSREECRFVMAHEFLHAALRHDVRHLWRDAYLWNVACDYVINDWLTQMGVGESPEGLLYDVQFKGMSAESVYDMIVTDIRTFRKLATLRGVGLTDVLPGSECWWERGDGVDLDAFYRRAIAQGLEYHREQDRGYLPEGLVEEIRALCHPPIPWDVELARWFDEQFTPLEKIRSYARPSRRQSSTPDIPRPSWTLNQCAMDGRTFGVVLDTSGSMERGLLAAALGAIASYSAARDVPAARVVFCDAEAYDQGYLCPEDIAGVVKVKGRGGTVLQPGIDRLLEAEDFPRDAPILVITDAGCEDRLVFRGREHAFLVPQGANLPFAAKGKVFRMGER